MAIGAAFSLNLIEPTTTAEVARDLTAGSITVSASTESSSEAKTMASAKGEKDDDKDSGKQSNDQVQNNPNTKDQTPKDGGGNSTPEQRMQLLDVAVQLVAGRGRPIPLAQYVDLLDLSFALGFRTDALAKLREQYGFDYVDHAKAGRPREADRAGRTTFFARDAREPREWLSVLGMEGTPSRQQIIAAYRRLAAQHHPDRFHDAEDGVRSDAAMRFIEITRAYEALLAIYKE